MKQIINNHFLVRSFPYLVDVFLIVKTTGKFFDNTIYKNYYNFLLIWDPSYRILYLPKLLLFLSPFFNCAMAAITSALKCNIPCLLNLKSKILSTQCIKLDYNDTNNAALKIYCNIYTKIANSLLIIHLYKSKGIYCKMMYVYQKH